MKAYQEITHGPVSGRLLFVLYINYSDLIVGSMIKKNVEFTIISMSMLTTKCLSMLILFSNTWLVTSCALAIQVLFKIHLKYQCLPLPQCTL